MAWPVSQWKRILRLFDGGVGSLPQWERAWRQGRGKEDGMIQLQRLGHVLLRVGDIERSKAFYTKTLGFEVAAVISAT